MLTLVHLQAVPCSTFCCSSIYVAVKTKTQAIYTKALQIFILFYYNFLFLGQFRILFTFYFTVKRRIFYVTYFPTSQIWFALTSAKKKREKQQGQSNEIIKLHINISSCLPTLICMIFVLSHKYLSQNTIHDSLVDEKIIGVIFLVCSMLETHVT